MLKRHRSVVIESMEPRVLFDAGLLTETIVSSTLPAAVSDHAVFHGTVVMNIANNSGVDEKENKVEIGILIANGPLIIEGGVYAVLKAKPANLNIPNGASKTYSFPVNIAKGKLADGVDTMYGTAVNSEGIFSQSVAGPSFTVHPPIVTLSETETFVKLSDTVVSGSNARPSVKVGITNSGTDASTDPLAIGVYATTDGIAADGVPITSISKKVTINAGKTVNVSLPIPGVPKLAAGTYQIITQVTQHDGTITTTDPATAPTITIAMPTTGPLFSDTIDSVTPSYEPDQLDGAEQTLTNLTMSMEIINAGATTNGSEPLTLFASTSSTFDSSAVAVGQITLELGNIPGNGGKRTFNASFNTSPNFPGTPDSNGNTNLYIFVQVTDPAGNITMASFPNTVNFAGPIVP
jgi:hypothetical protein